MTAAGKTALRELAARAGILSEYVDQTGKEVRTTSDETRRALLDAMSFREDEEIATVRVVEVGQPVGQNHAAELELESGDRRPLKAGQLSLPPLGYHRLRFGNVEQSLIIVPPRCVTPTDVVGDSKIFGLIANLYTLRSARNWGVGDLTDLAALAEWCGSVGGEFVGVNPLHALLNRGHDVSPYSPVSRLFRNPIYIDVNRIPQLVEAPELRSRIASSEFVTELEALRESRSVRYEQVMAVKGLVFDALYKVFVESGRTSEYGAYVSESDPELTRFATWMAIAERHGSDWHKWPAELRRPDSTGVSEFVRAHAARIDFHRWLQFETDRQLADAARVARSSGMRVGLYQDLAVGSSGSGADTWAFPELFAHGVSVGAPPDPYAAQGQNWGFPPIDPHALRRSGYRYFIDVLRQGFRHSGALRIDHVLGLFRVFWIPDGKGGESGAYVRSPTNDLFGILALESARHNALVVGEDLGTVPPEVPPTLAKWSVLSSKVMFFERDTKGGFNPASTYPELALATADTHDMAPVTGFWNARDIELRRATGLIEDTEAAHALARRDEERAALLERLAEEKVLPSDVPHTPAQLRGAVHAFMCRTPARLVGLSLDDLAGETEPVNIPGVGQAQFHSWTRKMTEPVEVIVASDDTVTALRCDGRRGVRHA